MFLHISSRYLVHFFSPDSQHWVYYRNGSHCRLLVDFDLCHWYLFSHSDLLSFLPALTSSGLFVGAKKSGSEVKELTYQSIDDEEGSTSVGGGLSSGRFERMGGGRSGRYSDRRDPFNDDEDDE